jgi:hypothetical protein
VDEAPGKVVRFSELFDVALLAQIVGVDEWGVEGVLGPQADRAAAAGVQEDGQNSESLATQGLRVYRIPYAILDIERVSFVSARVG